MIICALDIECTCGPGVSGSEIIQIGSHWIDLYNKEITHSENYLFSPDITKITSFCTRLTGITKEMVEDKKSFKEEHETFFGDLFYYKTDFITSWTTFDIKKINEQLNLFSTNLFWPENKYFDSEKIIRANKEEKRTMSLSKAVEMLGLDFSGKKHNGYDDAKNLANIILKNPELFLQKLK